MIPLGILTLTLLIVEAGNIAADFFGQNIFLGYVKLFMSGLILLSLFFFRIKFTSTPSEKDKFFTLFSIIISTLMVISLSR